MRGFYILFLWLFSLVCVYGQNAVSVEGVVVDAKLGGPLVGVSVVVKGTGDGTVTDFNGKFKINVKEGQVLRFSYLGFKTKEVTVDATVSVVQIQVQLEQDVQGLEEVVVVGYGTLQKRDVTGSVQTIDARDFNKSVTLSSEQMIQGKLPGVQVVSNGGGVLQMDKLFA